MFYLKEFMCKSDGRIFCFIQIPFHIFSLLALFHLCALLFHPISFGIQGSSLLMVHIIQSSKPGVMCESIANLCALFRPQSAVFISCHLQTTSPLTARNRSDNHGSTTQFRNLTMVTWGN